MSPWTTFDSTLVLNNEASNAKSKVSPSLPKYVDAVLVLSLNYTKEAALEVEDSLH